MSNYDAIDCAIDNGDGTLTKLAGVTVNVYDVTHSAALLDLTADSSGHIPAGTLSVAVGTTIRFGFKRTDLVAAYDEVITT